MAGRPNKEGLDYFPVDVFIEHDPRVEELILAHPNKGFEVYIRTLIPIYRFRGYFIVSGQHLSLKMAKNCSTEAHVVNAIYNTCLEVGLFNQELYQLHGIYTSGSIQDRYVRSITRRSVVYIIKDFSLLDPGKIDNPDLLYLVYDDVRTVMGRTDVIENYVTKATSKENVNPNLKHTPPVRKEKKSKDPSATPAAQSAPDPSPPLQLSEPIYGTKQRPLPFDWNEAQLKLLADKEWHYDVCRNLGIGTGNATVPGDFKPDYAILTDFLQKFFLHVAANGEQKPYGPGLKSHFNYWHQKKDTILKEEKKKTGNRPIDVGSGDYKNQRTWK